MWPRKSKLHLKKQKSHQKRRKKPLQKPKHLLLGVRGEDLAKKYLQRNKYKILECNFKARYGEIDIISTKDDTLVFVEVKTRVGDKYGTPEEAITPWKLRELTKTAQYYKIQNPDTPDAMRIDLIAIRMDSNGELQNLNHIQNISM